MKISPNHIHFLGIAGIGVSALAQLAQARGIRVSGSDPNADPEHSPAIARLQAGGAVLYTNHNADNLAPDVDLVVATAAVSEDNPEIRAARERAIPVVSRAEFLGQLMAAHIGPKIAVAGTHGKTTTTGMIGVMLQHAGCDPTVFVGGEVVELGGNVRIGSETGPFVAEACEAYDSFLALKPDIAVITNIEADHLDHFGTLERVQKAFLRFAHNVPAEGGTLIVCADDPGIQSMEHSLADMPGKQLAFEQFGIEDGAAGSRASHIVYSQKPTFDWEHHPSGIVSTQRPTDAWEDYACDKQATITLSVPGRHNVLNALAAATVGSVLKLSGTQIAEGLEAFRGATRRQDILGEGRLAPEDADTVLVMDDYAHHPTEIRATFDALRSAYPNRRLAAIFQPHLYSRTRDFLEQFAHSLVLADLLIVTDIYGAREAPMAGISASDIVARAQQLNGNLPLYFVPDKNTIPSVLRALARPGDLCVFLGAGDIREQGEAFIGTLLPGQHGKITSEAKSIAKSITGRRRIAVLMGGTSSEREISLSTGRMIASALDPLQYDVIAIDTQDLLSLQGGRTEQLQTTQQPLTDVTPHSDAMKEPAEADEAHVADLRNSTSDKANTNFPLHNQASASAARPPDLVFIALHGRGGEDGAVQGLLEVLGLPYTGSGILASALAMDKTMSKRLFRGANIPVAPEIVLKRNSSNQPNGFDNSGTSDKLSARIVAELGGFPVFIKPNAEGSTVGGTLVSDTGQLTAALSHAFRYDDQVLIETYLRGMEITVSVLGNTGDEIQALPVIEIVPKAAFYDYESKYADGGSEHIIPARLSEAQTRQVQQLAVQCHTLLGCRGMSRTDFILTSNGPFVLEVNTIPGMTPTSLLPQAAARAGISFPQLLDKIVSLAGSDK